MQCDDGYRIGIKETTVFSPGVERFPAFDVSDVKVEDGQMVATIGGTDDDPDGRTPDTELHVGESVVNKKAGRRRGDLRRRRHCPFLLRAGAWVRNRQRVLHRSAG